MHSVLLTRWTYAVRMHSAYRAHVLKKSTSVQRVAGALNEWPAHEARMKRARTRMQRALNAQPANGSNQMQTKIGHIQVLFGKRFRIREA